MLARLAVASTMPSPYDLIGTTYARSRRADPAISRVLAQLLQLKPTGTYLDVGCGTGNYTLALSALGGAWSAVDVSEVMLAQARSKTDAVAWVQADADCLPFADASFDGAICTLAIHHFDSLDATFAEVRRTLRSGQSGAFVIFTGLAEQMCQYWLCHYFPQMMERSMAKMPTESAIRSALSRAGFKAIAVAPFFVTNGLEDLFLYSGKHRPALYLDAAVRANISSFAQLAPPAELQEGLARLTADIQSGAFAAIQARYANGAGDYAFVTAWHGS